MGFEIIKENVRNLDIPDDEIEEIISNLDGVFLSLVNNFSEKEVKYIKDYEEVSDVNTAFGWSSTPQGRDYWSSLHVKYRI